MVRLTFALVALAGSCELQRGLHAQDSSEHPANRKEVNVAEDGRRQQPDTFINTNGATMRLIPAGSFQMGSVLSPDEVARRFGSTVAKSERPQHRVTITKPFYLSTTEVTVDQFRKFVVDADYRTEAERDSEGGFGFSLSTGRLRKSRKYNWKNPGFSQLDTHPVVNVSWNDARKFCDWLSREEGRSYSLPTESQWEYACRAGTNTSYHFGEDAEMLPTWDNVLDSTANAAFPGWSEIKASDGYVTTAPVGTYKANRFGLFDMHGNVREWCADWYGKDYYAVSPPLNPRGPASGPGRVSRGGSWGGTSRTCRAGARTYSISTYCDYSLGFRVASACQ
jgi:formylglycine-generating enzyme required for sulfatase activity